MRILNSNKILAFGALLGGVVATSPAFAGGLPQLDPTTFAPQVVWLTISFIALYVLMSKIALPRISDVLEERQNKIDDNLSKAEELRLQAEAASEAYEMSLSDARSKAQDAIRSVKNEAADEAAKRQADLNVKLQSQIAKSEKAIAKARDEALSGIKEVATDVAACVVEKLIGDVPNDKSLDSAVNVALKERA